MDRNHPSQLLSPKQVAAHLGKSVRWVREMLRTGRGKSSRLPYKLVNGRKLVPLDHLEAWEAADIYESSYRMTSGRPVIKDAYREALRDLIVELVRSELQRAKDDWANYFESGKRKFSDREYFENLERLIQANEDLPGRANERKVA